MTEPTKWQVAQGSTAEHCTKWPAEGHSTSVHMRGGALVSVRRCDGCGWIDFADLDKQVRAMQGGWARLERQAARQLDVRDTPEAAAERAAWTRDLARMLREQTEAPAHLRPGILYAANFLDPDDTAHLMASPANVTHLNESIASLEGARDPLTSRLGEQREALHAAREIFRALDVDNDSGLAFAIGAGTSTNITMWMDRFGKLADPPMVVEVEDDDESDDEPATEEPGAGESSGRWQPLDVAGGAAHLDFAEDAARRARGRCVNDTDGDGDCPACAHNPDVPCRQVPDA
jgi:hypothetical protein